MQRRTLLLAGLPALALPLAVHGQVRRGRALAFPRDHGAHLDARTEWWYATGWLGPGEAPTHGFQVTFFRSLTGVGDDSESRFAPRHLLFAHAAVTDVAGRRHRHAQRIARWAGRGPGAAEADTDVRIGRWRFVRGEAGYRADLAADDFALDLQLAPTGPLLLQGDAGFSRKGPKEGQASHYYSQPQLAASGRVTLDGRTLDARGHAWLDHEWSDEYLAPEAVGWDWIGINLFDGGALMAFRIRRADGSALWAGGTLRAADGTRRAFGPGELVFTPGRRWTSPASQAAYPVEWTLQTPAGRFGIRALMDEQELDSRGSTGAIYWEGLSALTDEAGRRIGLGYLELTGYAARLRMS